MPNLRAKDQRLEARGGASTRGVMEPVTRVNVDGVEGSSIPGGLHLAKYGGGDDYRQVSEHLQ